MKTEQRDKAAAEWLCHLQYKLARAREYIKSKSELSYDRRSVGQSVLEPDYHLANAINFFQFIGKYYQTCAISSYETPSLTRGRVCNLGIQLLLSLAKFLVPHDS
jgi:hypothetical protein